MLAKKLDALVAGNRRLQEGNRELQHANHQMAKCLRAILEAHRELQQGNHQMAKCLPGALAQEISPAGTDVCEPAAADGLPVPADFLRYLVAGEEDLKSFFATGSLCARALHAILARQGKSLGQFARALDFGCGCGRILCHLKGVAGVEFHGSDCNWVAIDWCQKHLPFARFALNALEPPLDYPDGFFNLVFAFSVFTHLTEPLQTQWMKELRRVLVPGGHLLVTVHGERRVDLLSAAERAEFQKGRLVVRAADVAGTNCCAVFHPPGYVRAVLARGFEVVDFLPEGADRNPPQDVFLMRSITDRS